MQEHLAWAILGLALVIVEVFTGTFYLLVLALAAFGAAAAAFLAQPFAVQAVVFVVVAGVGVFMVHSYRARNLAEQMPPVDEGQPATFEAWIDEPSRLARVRYRGASWDARIDEGGAPAVGQMLYVVGTNGNTLRVSNRRPV